MDLSKNKVAVAAANHSKLDLSSTHITTDTWLHCRPVYYRHMIPGEHLKGSCDVVARLAPVVVPTYGRCRVNMRSFFVPFRTVFPQFTEFFVDTIASDHYNSSLVSSSPFIRNSTIVNWLIVNSTVVTAPAPYDFEVSGVYHALTDDGRRIFKVLCSLGYRPCFDLKNDKNYSALALLCYAKVYFDWYTNASYMDSANYLYMQRLFKYYDPTSPLEIDGTALIRIIALTQYVVYDSGRDVFLNAWDNPVAPNSGLYSSGLQGSDITSATLPSEVMLDTNGTPIMFDSNSSGNLGSLYLHQLLRSMTDYIKRNQLAGSRQVDRFLAKFGINLDSAKVDRCIYVNSQSVDIDFGQVMNQAETSQGSVGDYAGLGFGRGSTGFDFKADEFGLFVVVSSIVPTGTLYQGMDRNNLHLTKDEFFNPEFDNLGVQAISKREVYVSRNSMFGGNVDYDGVFGFAPRYYEYKQKQDFVTGDFECPSVMQGGSAWHLNRVLDDNTFLGSHSNLVHSLDFTRGLDYESYNRVFQSTKNVDQFYCVYHFAVEGLAPCKSLFDTYDFEDAANKITMQSGGSKVN